MEYYERKLDGLLGLKGNVRIVQIGAFDGVSGDPIHDWVKAHKDKTEILLIEPQEEAFALLKENYAYHPNAKFLNCAISPNKDKVLKMYAAQKRGWGSGTTADIAYHAKFVSNRGVESEQYGAKEVECMVLDEALNKTEFGYPVDVLQVDCEGYDDMVLSACNLESLKPEIINYEFSLMDKGRQANTDALLKVLGYEVHRWSERDKCAKLMKN